MKKICIEVEKKLCLEAETVLSDVGLEIPNIINSVLKKIVREGSVEFIFAKSSASVVEVPKSVSDSEKLGFIPASVTPAPKITKTIAKSILSKKGHFFDAPVVFSSRNKATKDYWANPNVDTVRGKWYLILNDQYGRRLYLFEITEEGKAEIQGLVPRSDKPELINLQIYGNDTNCFMDKISGVMFRRYLIDEVDY